METTLHKVTDIKVNEAENTDWYSCFTVSVTGEDVKGSEYKFDLRLFCDDPKASFLNMVAKNVVVRTVSNSK
ncbi:MAG: hypothetical protein VW518_00790 [Burkholderiaceae bacterium]